MAALNNTGISDRAFWEEAGYSLLQYDREIMIQRTKEEPDWIHFGAGNIFRAFLANISQNLLNQGITCKGIIAAEGFDAEIIDKVYRPYDDLGILVTLKADGNVEKSVIASVAQSLVLDRSRPEDQKRLQEIFCKDSLKMASFTITEKGYSLVDANGELLKAVEKDYENGPLLAESYMGKVTSLVYERYLHGKKPIALVSMDNCSHNGDKLLTAVLAYARNWEDKGHCEKGFCDYITNPSLVSFPWSMIDKITPRPDPIVMETLKKDGLTGMEPIITSKNTYAAAYVNAEECEYLVVEDWFPAGRPKLEAAGVMFAERSVVDKTEKMKVCTCLNPLHTGLAIFGCLLGYTLISEEMKDSLLVKLVETIGGKEGIKVVVNPGILDPEEFLRQVISVRLPNPFMPDSPQRIATDTSQKLPIRFGETIKAYEKSESLSTESLVAIPLVLAGWLRYLTGVDDSGNPMECSPDPRQCVLQPIFKEIACNKTEGLEEKILPLLADETLFGCDLTKTSLSDKVIQYFKEMMDGRGSVRKTLEKYL